MKQRTHPHRAAAFHARIAQRRNYTSETMDITRTWKKLLDEALRENGESWDDVEANTLTPEELDVKFHDGNAPSIPFTMWTNKAVYFPNRNEDTEWVESVARHPDSHATAMRGQRVAHPTDVGADLAALR